MFVTVNDFLKNDEYKPKCTLFCEFVFKGGVGYNFLLTIKRGLILGLRSTKVLSCL